MMWEILVAKLAKIPIMLVAAFAVGLGVAEVYEHTMNFNLAFIHVQGLGPKLKAETIDPATGEKWVDEYKQAQVNFTTAQSNYNKITSTLNMVDQANRKLAQDSQSKTAAAQVSTNKGNSALAVETQKRARITSVKMNMNDVCQRVLEVDSAFTETLK